MSRVSKKNDIFYQHFAEFGEALPQAAQCFLDIVTGWPETSGKIAEMSMWERRCDEICASVIVELNKSFITPFDREDINHLIRTMDEIVDQMEDCAVRFDTYNVGSMVDEAAQMAQLILESCEAINIIMQHLPNFKKDPQVMQQVMKVASLEDKGDNVHRMGLSNIFDGPQNPIHTIKWKSLLDTMEKALDCCKLVSNEVQSVVMKNA